MTGEPKVEDLLASIRKAIDEDQPGPAEHTNLTEQGRLMRGSMREMRVQLDEPQGEAVYNENTKPAFSGILSGRDRPRIAEAIPEPATRQNQRRELINETEYDELLRVPQSHRQRNEYASAGSDWSQRPSRGGSLMSQNPAQSAQQSFDRLAESLMARAGGDRTIEDITRELLRGYLRQWLDDNLPSLVERLVREEIERVARRGR